MKLCIILFESTCNSQAFSNAFAECFSIQNPEQSLAPEECYIMLILEMGPSRSKSSEGGLGKGWLSQIFVIADVEFHVKMYGNLQNNNPWLHFAPIPSF